LITLAKRAKSDATDGGVETRNVATSSKDADDAFLGIDICHALESPFQEELNEKLSPLEEFLGRGEPDSTN